MASPLHKMAHQQTMKGNGINTRHNMQQRMPNMKPQGNVQLPQMRYQVPPQPRHSPQNQQMRMHHPQYQQQRHNPPALRLQSPQQQQQVAAPLQNQQQKLQPPVQKMDDQQFQVPSQKIFTKQPVDVAKDTEKLKSDQERLAAIHTQLYSEAEKIRQWKSEKEMEIKQKGRSLSDAIQTIDNLRKSIIELQFQNEEYSTKLNEKEKEKEATEQKLNTVREMAHALRDQMVHLEKQIEQGVQDKEDIKKVKKRMIEENQNLVHKFQELDISQNNLIEKHSQEILSLQDKYEREIKELQDKIIHLENQVVSLMDTKKSQEEEIKEYSIKLSELNETFGKLNEEYLACQKQLQEVEQVRLSQDQDLSTLKLSFEDLSKRFEICTKSLEETSDKLKTAEEKNSTLEKHSVDVEEIYSKEISSLQSDLKDVTAELKDYQLELKTSNELHEKKEQLITDLKYEREKGAEVVRSLEVEIKTLEAEKIGLLNEKNVLSEKLLDCEQKLVIANEELQRQKELTLTAEHEANALSTSKGTLGTENETLKGEVEELTKKIEHLQRTAEDTNNVLKSTNDDMAVITKTIEEKINEVNSLEKAKSELQEALNSAKEEIENKVNEIALKKSEAEEAAGKYQEKVAELESVHQEIEALKELNTQQENMLKSLREKEQENAETLKTELADKEKETEDLGHKSRSLQGQITVKTKQIKNLEKENKTLKTNVKTKSDKIAKQEEQLKSMEERENTLTETMGETEAKLNVSLKQIEELRETNEKDMNIYKSDLESEQKKCSELEEQLKVKEEAENKLHDLLKKSEEACETSEQEKKLFKADLDLKQRNFCATLEQYKLENDSIVEAHVKENRMLQLKLQEIETKYTEETSSIQNIQSKLKELQAKYEEETSNLLSENKKCNVLIKEHLSRIKELELASVDGEIKDTKFSELEKLLQSSNANLEVITEENKVLKETNDSMQKQISDMGVRCEETVLLKEKVSNLENLLKVADDRTKNADCLTEQNKTLKEDNQALQDKMEKLQRELSDNREIQDKENRSIDKDRLVPTTPSSGLENLPQVTPSSNIRGSQSSRGKRVLFAGIQNTMDVEEDMNLSQKSTPKTPKGPVPRTPSSFYGGGGTNPRTPKSNVRLTPKPSRPVNKYEGKDLSEISPVKKVQKVSQIPVSKDRSVSRLVADHYDAVKGKQSNILSPNINSNNLSKVSPGDVPRKSFATKKMKKLTPKVKERANLSWFDDSNSVFGFDG